MDFDRPYKNRTDTYSNAMHVDYLIIVFNAPLAMARSAMLVLRSLTSFSYGFFFEFPLRAFRALVRNCAFHI